MAIRMCVLAFAIAVGSTVHADVALGKSPTEGNKEQAIRKLLQLTRASEMAAQMMDQMAGQLRPMFPQVPESFWGDFIKEVKPEELIKRIVPIYGRHLSDSEIADLVKFYESPIGKKLVSVQPLIVQESVAVGQVWGRELGERVVKRLKDKGLLDGKKK